MKFAMSGLECLRLRQQLSAFLCVRKPFVVCRGVVVVSIGVQMLHLGCSKGETRP